MILFRPQCLILCLLFCIPSPLKAQLDTLAHGIGNPEVEASVLFMEAIQARIKGDKAKSKALLEKVVELQPEAAGAYYDLARIHMPENMEEAREHIQKAIDLQPENKYYLEQKAQILAYDNDYEGAAQIYRSLARQQKHNEDYWQKAALLFGRAENYMRALECLNELLVQNPGDEEVLIQKQQIFLKINEVDEAAGVARELIRLYPEEGRYYVLLAEIYMSNDRMREAEEAFKAAEEKFGDDPMVILSLAQYYRSRGEEDKYKDYLSRGMAHKAMSVESQIAVLIRFIQDFGEDSSGKAEALDLAGVIARQNPGNAEIYGVYGDLLSMAGRRLEAAEAYKQSLESDPSRFALWQNLIYSYATADMADSLIRYSEKCLRLFPNQAMIHYLNGVGHLFKKQYEAASRAIERALDLQPEGNTELLAEMHATLGDVYEALKDYENSEEHYQQALKLDPHNPMVLNNYSYYLSLRGQRLDEALDMSGKTLEMKPDEPSYLDTYGWILYRQGKYEKAREYIQRALDLSPESDATLWDHLGDVYWRLGEQEKARASWKKALERGAEEPEKLERKIKEGKVDE